MPTPQETLTDAELRLKAVIDDITRARRQGKPVLVHDITFPQPATSQEKLFQATIRDVVENGRQSPFSGASDAGIDVAAEAS